ncbi:hypothetical protein DFH09DRAFT_409167 [Mycena vulgaris]|nr:hypothetical protein DFH09DRAFT_409167 [Mycena vulgaris]
MLYTFPQSVGTAGGRPSSSYYFVGIQGDGRFYLDGLFYLYPHHSRPAVPLRPFTGEPAPPPTHGTHAHDDRRSLRPEAYTRGGSMSPDFPRGGSLSPDFGRAGSMSPEYGPAHGQGHAPMRKDSSCRRRAARAAPARTPRMRSRHRLRVDTSAAQDAHFAGAYSTAELRTFHCERVRKMPLTGPNSSVLIGFVCRGEAEWIDLRRRVAELPWTIFAIQDERPKWPRDVSSASHAPLSRASHAMSNASHAVSHASRLAAATFSHTHAHSDSQQRTQ